MEKQFEGIFELFDLKVRRLRNGNKLCLIFESAEDIEMEKQLIEFRGENVKAIITQENPESKKIITIEDEFEVFDLKCRRLRNGDKLTLTLEEMYSKEKEFDAVNLRYEDCKIFLKLIEQELDFEEEEENEI